MGVGQQSLLEREFPYYAPQCCPECGTRVDLRTALCGDEANPLRRVGCVACGLWLVRNERSRTHWRPLLGWSGVLLAVHVTVPLLARDHLARGWAALVEGLLILGTMLVVARVLNARYVRRIGPPWIAADGERAEVSPRTR